VLVVDEPVLRERLHANLRATLDVTAAVVSPNLLITHRRLLIDRPVTALAHHACRRWTSPIVDTPTD
jgi:hypothetical protein